ncbi:heme-degrading domain-containing protein [Pseudotabrizicola algicola]|uniref:Heme-degrading domain-containing protein n=1 Tax=Pseudotabrizicola algicola TaxID=2709381 RepID=A0A6B3RMV4_9RHOB|nr:heme-degrading domain-containing protein [Pseudotabrizicola algicola]NEX46513.1 heme-degrading domain-containing protein [Pseudotabrizicola algicola]
MTDTDLLNQIIETEATLVFPHFDEMTALSIGQTLVADGLAKALPIVIDIRTPDATLFHAALPGSAPDNDEWARRKSNVTLRCHTSSYAVGLKCKIKGTAQAELGLPLADFAIHGGSVPVRLRGGRVVAAVTVSGLPQAEDHAMVIAALTAELARLA